MFTTKKSAEEIVNEKGLKKIQDVEGLSNIASDVITDNPEAVQDYLSGKETVVKFLVGQMMKISRGKADPKVSESLIKDKLKRLQQ